jgi:hypothetical protein
MVLILSHSLAREAEENHEIFQSVFLVPCRDFKWIRMVCERTTSASQPSLFAYAAHKVDDGTHNSRFVIYATNQIMWE